MKQVVTGVEIGLDRKYHIFIAVDGGMVHMEPKFADDLGDRLKDLAIAAKHGWGDPLVG